MIAALALTLVVIADQSPPAVVKSACDTAMSILSKTSGLKTKRSNGVFNDETFRSPIPGCRIQIAGSFKKAANSGAAADNLHTGLMSRGWSEIVEFSADGPDGTSFAFQRDGVACFARGSWDGGDDSAPDQPVDDAYKLVVICGKAAAFVRPE
jgi:hypothetical protein